MAETIRELISEQDVDKRIEELGQQISRDYAGKSIHLICILKGGAFFMCELAKRITLPVTQRWMLGTRADRSHLALWLSFVTARGGRLR